MRTKKLSRPRIFRSRLIAVFAALGMLFLSLGGVTLAATTASGVTAHCFEHDSNPKSEADTDGDGFVGDTDVYVDFDGMTVRFFDEEGGDPVTVNYCIKASNDVVTSGTGTSATATGHDISYVVIYDSPTNPCPNGDFNGPEQGCGTPPSTLAVPANPGTTDPCGPNNISWNVPADTSQLRWDVTSAGHLTVTILTPNTTFTGTGLTIHDFGALPADSGVLCANTIAVPATPGVTDPCGPNNISWNMPADTTQLDWRLTGTVLSVHIVSGSATFPGGALSHSYGPLGPDSNEPCPVNPTVVTAAVDFDNPTCLDLDGSDIDFLATEGITYTVVGTPDLGNSVTVKATPKAGYVLAAGSEDTFTHEFPSIEDLDCDEVLPTEGSDVCPNIPGNQVTVPKGMVLVGGVCDEPEVLGTETASPTPGVTPVDNGPDALPTAVDAGFGGPTPPSSGSLTTLLAQSMMGAGLLFLIAAGWLQRGRQNRGVHQF